MVVVGVTGKDRVRGSDDLLNHIGNKSKEDENR